MRRDPSQPIEPANREQILAATSHHPYVRLAISGRELSGFVGSGAAGWLVTRLRGTMASGFGPPEPALDLLARLARQGRLAAARRINLPRISHATLAGHLPVAEVDDWEFRWTRTAPPPQPGQDAVVRLAPEHGPAVTDLLERVLPDTSARPGESSVRCWYGTWSGSRLVACGADRSRGGVGSISAIAVDPAERSRGLGAALTAAMTTDLLREWDVVTLGVMSDNQVANRLYRRLGFTEAVSRTSAHRHRLPGRGWRVLTPDLVPDDVGHQLLEPGVHHPEAVLE